jgi:chromate reductase, NAD(P)H dehydrogenase (quinone)
MTRRIAVIVGSLRANSNSGRLAHAIAAEAPKSVALDIVPISDLPLYNPDLDGASPPAAWTAFRDSLKGADAVLFVTPEYNRSVPGALKNAIDVGSRPYGQSAFAGKPAAVVSSSMGPIAGFGANHHLRQSLTFLDMPTLQQPEMYLGSVTEWFDEAGKVKSADTRAFLGKFAAKFADWIETTAPRV